MLGAIVGALLIIGGVLSAFGGWVLFWLGFFMIVGLYFLPLVIAERRRVRYQTSIFLINVLFGWTVVGWIGALVWSIMEQEEPRPPSTPYPLRQHNLFQSSLTRAGGQSSTMNKS